MVRDGAKRKNVEEHAARDAPSRRAQDNQSTDNMGMKTASSKTSGKGGSSDDLSDLSSIGDMDGAQEELSRHGGKASQVKKDNAVEGRAVVKRTALELAIAMGRIKSRSEGEVGRAQDELAEGLDTLPTLFPPSSITLPSSCEVTSGHLQSDSLRDIYKGLPALRAGSFTARNEVELGEGSMIYDDWYIHCPHMDIEGKCLPAMEFVHSNRLVNLARCDPRLLKAVINTQSHGGAKARVLVFNDNHLPAVNLAAIRVTKCQLLQSGPTHRKSISGVMHSQDVERFIAATCMIFDEANLDAPLFNNAFSFETRPSTQKASSTTPTKPSTSLRSPTKAHGNAVIRNRPSGSNDGGYIKTSLSAAEEVIIYDGRYTNIKWPTDLSVLDKRLPRYNEEIPKDSFAVVAHTMTTYPRKQDGGEYLVAVSLNVQWVLLLGTPDQEAPLRE